MKRKLEQMTILGCSLLLAGLVVMSDPTVLASEAMPNITKTQQNSNITTTDNDKLKNYQMPMLQNVALEREFDYTSLDEPGDREGFTSQSINTPVKVFDDEFRDYYGFFGGTKPTDTSANFLAKKSSDAASQVGKPLNSSILSFLNPAIIAVPKDQTKKPITYSYAFDAARNVPAGQTGFDFAELDQQNKLNYTASLYVETLVNTRGFSESIIEEFLVSEDKKTMYVYGKQKLFGSSIKNWNSPSRPIYYVRTKITLLKNGRARFTLRVFNPSEETKKLTASFGNHMDIEGQHVTSKMYTMGNSEGLYFKEAKLKDGYPYLLNFHLSGYMGNPNPPQNYKANNKAAFTLINGLGNHTMTYPVTGDVDKPAETQIPLPSTHPGFTFQYQPVEIAAKSYQDFDMDVSIRTEVNEVIIEATDREHNKGEEFDGKLGVKAYDVEDGDLMSVLKIDTSKLNVDRNGTYPVTYSVTDSDGNTATVTIQVTVV